MTLIMGVRCSNGVVMGADSAATFVDGGGHVTIRDERVRKIQVIAGKMIFALTGSTAMNARIVPVLEEIWDQKVRMPPSSGWKAMSPQPKLSDLSSAEAAEWIRTILHNRVYGVEMQAAGLANSAGWRSASNDANSASMLAIPGKNQESFSLLSFNAAGLPDEMTDALYCNNIGSGQPIADPFMGFLRRVLWDNKPPTVEQATLGVVWCLDHAIGLHPGGVGGTVQVATLEFNKGNGWVAKEVPQDQLGEHRQDIAEMESLLKARHSGKTHEAKAAPIPTPPKSA